MRTAVTSFWNGGEDNPQGEWRSMRHEFLGTVPEEQLRIMNQIIQMQEEMLRSGRFPDQQHVEPE